MAGLMDLLNSLRGGMPSQKMPATPPMGMMPPMMAQQMLPQLSAPVGVNGQAPMMKNGQAASMPGMMTMPQTAPDMGKMTPLAPPVQPMAKPQGLRGMLGLDEEQSGSGMTRGEMLGLALNDFGQRVGGGNGQTQLGAAMTQAVQMRSKERQAETQRQKLITQMRAAGLDEKTIQMAQFAPEAAIKAALEQQAGFTLSEGQKRIGPDGSVIADNPKERTAPNGYQWAQDGSLKYIPGGPGDPSVIRQGAESRHISVNVGGFNPNDSETQKALGGVVDQMMVNGGKVPPGFSRNPAIGLKLQALYADRLAALGDTAGSQQVKAASLKAAQDSLTQISKQRAAVSAFEKTFQDNIGVMERLLPKVGQGGIPVANRWINAGRKSVAGDPDVAAFNTALQTVQAEYAKIMSGSMGNTPVSDSARHHAEELINSAMTPQQLASVIQVLRQDAHNRMAGFDSEAEELRSSIGGVAPEASAGAPAVKWGRDAAGRPVRLQ